MGLFNWNKTKSETSADEKSRQPVRRPIVVDWTEDYVANVDLLSQLYHNNYPGLKLAGALAFPAIAIPVYFMGLPIPTTGDEAADKEIQELYRYFVTDEQQVHIQCHRDGTVWVWPKFNQRTGRPFWEFIRDDAVTDVVKDIETGDPIKVYTDEYLTVTTGYNMKQNVRRIREFTSEEIVVRYEGTAGIKGLENARFRNVIGELPIAFANNADGGDVRGHSDLSRIISDLKVYHDTELAQHRAIAKFQPKLVQQARDVSQWLTNNGFASDFSNVDPTSVDVILNLAEAEKTEFISLDTIADPFIETKKQSFKKIVQGSGIPEICWGLKTEGNNASVEESMGTLAHFVDDKKRQKQESYDRLWTATLALSRIGSMTRGSKTVTVAWDDMETVSAETKARIFESYAKGIQAIADPALATTEQIFRLWKKNYPGITEETFEEFTAGIGLMAEHKQFASARYDEVQGALTGQAPTGI